MTDTHTQCVLKRGGETQVAYIESKLAVVGKVVKIKTGEDIWDDGWCVAEAYQTVDSKTVNERSQDYKKTRKASDI